MFNEMIRIAKNNLATINEPIDSLPAAQVTVLLSNNNNFYVTVNDIDGTICKELKRNGDTKIIKMLTMWKEGNVDLPSLDFRNSLVEIDKYNCNTDVLLQEKDGYLIKKLFQTIS